MVVVSVNEHWQRQIACTFFYIYLHFLQCLQFFILSQHLSTARCSLENSEVGLQGQAYHWYSVVLRLDIHIPVYENRPKGVVPCILTFWSIVKHEEAASWHVPRQLQYDNDSQLGFAEQVDVESIPLPLSDKQRAVQPTHF